jgi:acyl-coenzyme A thioesterase PaaI-like protein
VGRSTEAVAEIWQEPARGAVADTRLLALPGLEQLRFFAGGASTAPPVARLTGRRLTEVEAGRVVYSLPVTGWLVGPKGTLHPGVLALFADAPLLAAVHTMPRRASRRST